MAVAKRKSSSKAAAAGKKAAVAASGSPESSRPSGSGGLKNLSGLVHASELWTGAGFRIKDGIRVTREDAGVVNDGALIWDSKGQVVFAGAVSAMPREVRAGLKTSSVRDLDRKQAVTPGWVDCHTHLVFAGNRASEFSRRCAGATYEEIAREGGGIQATVSATRAMQKKDLLALARDRVREAYAWGVRALEIKSGYGLDLQTEVKILEVAQSLKKEFPLIRFHITWLGAHAVPKGEVRADYVQALLREQLPLVAKKKLADSADIFVDEGYFTLDDARAVLTAAREAGLKIRVHADELGNTESARLAAQMGALSADHLLCISDAGIQALARSSTVAVLLPGTAYYLKKPHAPARRLIESGARVAVSTDFNPGTCMTQSLPWIMNLSALYLGMAAHEILCATTYNAAKALGMESEIGTLEAGREACHTVLPFSTFEECFYRVGWVPSNAP
ncbi:MAG: imidazolonepropionase [Bdellovibrionales bacterium]|nr:imidazolonepropionase [Bdellovibrionales bacterium]